MAYINTETKKALTPGIKAVLKKWNMSGTISTPDKSELKVTLRSGKLDLMRDAQANTDYPLQGHCVVNQYWLDRQFTVQAHREFFKELLASMKKPDWADRSDTMTDYFDISYYLQISIGSWDKEYAYV